MSEVMKDMKAMIPVKTLKLALSTKTILLERIISSTEIKILEEMNHNKKFLMPTRQQHLTQSLNNRNSMGLVKLGLAHNTKAQWVVTHGHIRTF